MALQKQELSKPSQENNTRTFKPRIDVIDSKTGYTMFLNLPGIEKENIKIEATRDYLEVKAEQIEILDEKWTPRHRERAVRNYYRKLTFSKPIDAQNIKTSIKDGILKLEVPLSPEMQKIQLKVN
ncbi:MAG: Hsp20/alpha crystallin family protein [Candidatus Hodarchaeales archaeon]|jgi:HSP20 family molecular chaperone IbpA